MDESVEQGAGVLRPAGRGRVGPARVLPPGGGQPRAPHPVPGRARAPGGSGPRGRRRAGRFTLALAELGATIVATDLSPVQLELHRARVAVTPAEEAVEDRYLLDVADTGRVAEGEFDVVVAFGGPLSYVFDQAGAAVRDLLRIGHVLVASVMSTLGTCASSCPTSWR